MGDREEEQGFGGYIYILTQFNNPHLSYYLNSFHFSRDVKKLINRSICSHEVNGQRFAMLSLSPTHSISLSH